MNLITTAEAEQHAQIASGTGGTFLDHLIKMVSVKLARYTGRDDWGPQQSRTEYHDGGTSFIMARVWPVVSFQIFEDIDHVWNADTELDVTDFYAMDNGIIHQESGRFYPGVRNIKLVYTAGYADVASIPDEIKYAALLQVEKEWNNRKRPGKGASAAFGMEPDAEITPEVAALIAPYARRTGFAAC
jgi:hypothetical protein